jgi:sensor c-di-GMP phosphodiesterase-like protein
VMLKFTLYPFGDKLQFHYLKSQGSCIAQGFYYSKPIDKNSFVAFVKTYSYDNFD